MLDTRRPFIRTDALAAGFTPKQLRGSRFRRLFHGVYVDARIPDHPLIRAQAALLVQSPGAVASHTTAALLYELPVKRDVVEHVMVPVASQRKYREGITCHVGETAGSRVVSGVRVAAPADLFLQLATQLNLVDLVVVGDAMARRGLATPADLVAAAAASTGRRSQLARRAAGLVRERVDSPMETRLRLLLLLAGLAEPDVNRPLLNSEGREIRRLDLSYPSVKLAVEYDGRHHIERQRQWERDIDRREEFEEHGWRFILVTSSDIYRDPERTLERVWRALRARGHAVPLRPRDEWRRYFLA